MFFTLIKFGLWTVTGRLLRWFVKDGWLVTGIEGKVIVRLERIR